VLAAAAGRVRAGRDGVADVNVREAGKESVKDRECGNGVVLEHGDGWETQYCHLRRGSVRVRAGEQVAAGQALGLVGMSGLSEYPHMHLSVRHQGKLVDPFRGEEESADCAAASPLWRAEVAAKLPYAPGAVYNAGFAPETPDTEAVRSGRYRKAGALGRAPRRWSFLPRSSASAPGTRWNCASPARMAPRWQSAEFNYRAAGAPLCLRRGAQERGSLEAGRVSRRGAAGPRRRQPVCRGQPGASVEVKE